MTKTIIRSPSQEEVAEEGVTPNKCNDFVCIEKEERKSLPTPPRSRSPSPTNVARDAAAQQIFVANEIKAILRHPVARKPFFEFFRTLNQVNLLYFWLDVELLNNEDVVADDEILSAVENLYEKYFSPFASSPVFIYADAMQNVFLREWLCNQLRSSQKSKLVRRNFFNHVQNGAALKLFELAVLHKFPEYLGMWQNAKRNEQSKKGYVGKKLVARNARESLAETELACRKSENDVATSSLNIIELARALPLIE